MPTSAISCAYLPSPTRNCPRTQPKRIAQPRQINRQERWAAGLLLLVALFLRCVYILHYRYDSDEPQHLHTTWGWTQGLLQYRDFFDNHTPLFHILFSPLVAALGERTDILTYMRVAMVPLWIVSLWCVWRLGSRLYSKRAGLWAAVFLSLLTLWFFCSVEYRTDNLWTPLWLGALTVLLTGELSETRAFSGGLLLGLCFCASMKTSALLLAAVLAAAIAACHLRPDLEAKRIRSVRQPRCSRCLLARSSPQQHCAHFSRPRRVEAILLWSHSAQPRGGCGRGEPSLSLAVGASPLAAISPFRCEQDQQVLSRLSHGPPAHFPLSHCGHLLRRLIQHLDAADAAGFPALLSHDPGVRDARTSFRAVDRMAERFKPRCESERLPHGALIVIAIVGNRFHRQRAVTT